MFTEDVRLQLAAALDSQNMIEGIWKLAREKTEFCCYPALGLVDRVKQSECRESGEVYGQGLQHGLKTLSGVHKGNEYRTYGSSYAGHCSSSGYDSLGYSR
jgi:hypothetical protein